MTPASFAGIVCYSYDHYGHGRSEPKEENNRCHMPDFNALVDDAFEYAKQIKASRSTEGATCPPMQVPATLTPSPRTSSNHFLSLEMHEHIFHLN